jgi:tRNA-specific 2-thiouridylase
MNFEDEFRKHIVEPFVDEYARGRTPNPCVRCNEHIKYRALLKKLPALGARRLATGHYARVDGGIDGRPFRLLRGRDAAKDQSYVLYMLGQEQLTNLILPVGDLTKSTVREYAARLGLDVAAKPDSVEICFVPDNNYRAFVDARAAPTPGEIRDNSGQLLGRHTGISGFTLGQRKGLGIATGKPRYVTAVDAASSTVTVGDESDLYSTTTHIEDLSWVAGHPPPFDTVLEAKARYRSEPASAVLSGCVNGTAEIRFRAPQRALTPGQAICFYRGDEVLGGGTISSSARSTLTEPARD